jgi:hypothetical protein
MLAGSLRLSTQNGRQLERQVRPFCSPLVEDNPAEKKSHPPSRTRSVFIMGDKQCGKYALPVRISVLQ